jgi:O-antigen/teichoic acid export membrane protein
MTVEHEPFIASKIVRNSFFILLARVIQIASSFFVVVAVARYLSLDQYGEYAYIVAFVSSIMALAYFGIQQVLIREIANNKASAAQTIGAAVELRTILSAAAILAVGVSMYFMHLRGVLLAAGCIAIASEFFLSLSMLSKSVFQAFEQMIYEPIITFIYSLVLVIGIATVIYFDLGFLWIFIVMAFANLAQMVVSSLILSQKFVRPVFTTDRTVFRKFLKDAVVIGIGIFFYQNQFRINVLMLKWLGTVDDVAYFQAPHSLIMQLQVVPMSMAMAVFPVFSRLMNTDPEKLALLYEKIFRFMLLGSLFCALFIALFARDIISLVYGLKYVHSVAVLSVVAWAVIPLTMDMLLNVVLIAMHKQKYSVIYAGGTLALNSLLAVLFIPAYGFRAAAYLSVLSYTILFLCSLYFVERNGLFVRLDRMAVKIVATILFSGAAIVALKPLSPPAAALAGTIVFCGLAIMTRIVTLEEVRLIKGMIRNFPQRRGPE